MLIAPSQSSSAGIRKLHFPYALKKSGGLLTVKLSVLGEPVEAFVRNSFRFTRYLFDMNELVTGIFDIKYGYLSRAVDP
jgi:hypothetical protein